MNVFWLLSILLLWNATCGVQGRLSTEIEWGDCKRSEKGLTKLLTTTETFGSVSKTTEFFKTYRVSAIFVISLWVTIPYFLNDDVLFASVFFSFQNNNTKCTITCFRVKNTSLDGNGSHALVAVTEGTLRKNIIKVVYQLSEDLEHRGPVTFAVTMVGTCPE